MIVSICLLSARMHSTAGSCLDGTKTLAMLPCIISICCHCTTRDTSSQHHLNLHQQ